MIAIDCPICGQPGGGSIGGDDRETGHWDADTPCAECYAENDNSAQTASDCGLTIREWQQAVHSLARTKGWWPGQNSSRPYELAPVEIASRLCLIHSEISEALEAVRQPEGRGNLGEELADATIRIMDLCGGLGIDLESEMAAKHGRNASRPYRHGGKRL